MAVIKTECPIEFKNKVKQFAKQEKKTESAIIRKAVQNYLKQEAFKGDKGSMMGMSY